MRTPSNNVFVERRPDVTPNKGMEFTPVELEAREKLIQASLSWVKEFDANEGDIASLPSSIHRALVNAADALNQIMSMRGDQQAERTKASTHPTKPAIPAVRNNVLERYPWGHDSCSTCGAFPRTGRCPDKCDEYH